MVQVLYLWMNSLLIPVENPYTTRKSGPPHRHHGRVQPILHGTPEDSKAHTLGRKGYRDLKLLNSNENPVPCMEKQNYAS